MTDSKNHRVVVVRRGGPDVLQVIEEDLPEPGADEVRVKVLAAGVSGFDVMVRSSSFPGFPRAPYTPGEDIVGVVDKLGAAVSNFEPGERLAGWTFGRGGGYTEYICMPARDLVPVPSTIDSAAAVTMVVNYLTAYPALHDTAEVRSGERVLIHGAAGGVGSALVQLGGLAGLKMYGTASHHNHELVAAMGATPIDYRNEDFVKRIRGLTGDGVDAAFDMIGGGRQLWRSYRALNKRGRLVMLGMAAGARAIPTSLATVGLLKLSPGGRRVPWGISLDKYFRERMPAYRDALSEFFDYAAARKVKPLVAARVPLQEAFRAHALLERGGLAGKVVLVTDN